MAALDGGPEFLKVSHEELTAGGYCDDDAEASLAAGARKLATKARNVVVSRAEKSVLAVLDGWRVTAKGPTVSAVDPTGAGDAMTGALAAGTAERGEARMALALGVAAGAMNATRKGRGSGRGEHIREFAQHIAVEEAS